MLIQKPQAVLSGGKPSQGAVASCRWVWMRPGTLGLQARGAQWLFAGW